MHLANTTNAYREPRRTDEDYLAESIRMRIIIEKGNPFDINAIWAKVEQMRFDVAGIEKDSGVTNSEKTKTETKP